MKIFNIFIFNINWFPLSQNKNCSFVIRSSELLHVESHVIEELCFYIYSLPLYIQCDSTFITSKRFLFLYLFKNHKKNWWFIPKTKNWSSFQQRWVEIKRLQSIQDFHKAFIVCPQSKKFLSCYNYIRIRVCFSLLNCESVAVAECCGKTWTGNATRSTNCFILDSLDFVKRTGIYHSRVARLFLLVM